MRIVLDVNVVVSGVFWRGSPHKVLRLWLEGEDTLLVSADILAEYREVLERLAGDSAPEIMARWNLLLTELSEMVAPLPLGAICRDPDDEKYLEAAVGGGAQALVSGDKDLLTLKEIRGIPILSPKAFLSRFRGDR